MQIRYTLDAFTSLTSLINFIEDKNTQGAGLRWLARYETFLQKELVNLKYVSLCKMRSSINYNFTAFSLMIG